MWDSTGRDNWDYSEAVSEVHSRGDFARRRTELTSLHATHLFFACSYLSGRGRPMADSCPSPSLRSQAELAGDRGRRAGADGIEYDGADTSPMQLQS